MISIIIPTLNEKSAIEETLKQLTAIRKILYEIIVSDGGSSDGTVAIVKRYTKNILLSTATERQTIAKAKNLGAKRAKGEYFIFIDADVRIPDPDKFFEAAISRFEADKNLVGLTVALRVYPEDETLSDRIFFGIANFLHRLNNNIFHVGSASGELQMVKSDAFRKIHGFNEALAVIEDNDLFARLSKIGNTRAAADLYILHSGRRAHKIGWPRLLAEWLINFFSVTLFKRSASKEWRPIR